MRRKSNCQDKKKISVTSDRHGEANREEATQRASLFEQSNREATQKANLFNQISIRDATQKLNLFRCQQKKKKKSVPHNQIRKGKRVVNQSKYTKLMDIDDQDMGIHFQEEIIMDILSRLPVQSLLRFKCVSRFWKKLISEPYFMMKHLNHAKNNQNSQKILVCQLCPKDGMISFYCSSLSSVQPVEDVRRLDCPSDFKPWRCGIFCCFDGLSLIGVHDYPDIDLICLLWNPSTRESIVLPHAECPVKGNHAYGMGYDSTSDDYKILKIDVDIDDGRKVSSEILALKNVSWRKIDRHPSDICYVLSGGSSLAFVHGAFHWLGFSRNYSMVSFSISNEVYKEIQLPEQICLGSMYNKFDVSVLEGMLCVYSTSIRKQSTFSFWLMKDYGVKESWTKLFTIRDTEIYLAIPKYRFANGEVLLRCIHAESCGPLFRTSKGPFGLWPQGDIFQDRFVFTESLISPKLLT